MKALQGLQHYLSQPYPLIHKGKNLLKITLLIFVVGFLFEYFVIPFERNPEEHNFSYAVISLIHVGLATLTYFLFYSLVSFGADEEEWNVGKEVLSVGVLLTLIGVGNWLIRDFIYTNPYNRDLSLLAEEVFHAFLSGCIIFLIVFQIYFRRLLHQQSEKAAHFTPSAPEQTTTDNQPIAILTQQQSDHFSLQPASLICVQAERNYLTFLVREKGTVKKLVKRLTMDSLEDQLRDYRFLVRTHRSYLVNLREIQSVRGNAQGYKLQLRDVEEEASVSRKYLEAFNRAASL